MRAAILGLSALIVVLSVSVVMEIGDRASGARRGTRFEVGRMLADARLGETAVYREQGGRRRRLSYRIAGDFPAAMTRVPIKKIEVRLADPRVAPEHARQVSYDHRLTDHFWFPLMEPRHPEELDRVWILRSIRRDELLVGSQMRPCWRVDLVDPALPEDSEHVIAWMDETVPVFGLLRWQRNNTVWELESREEAP